MIGEATRAGEYVSVVGGANVDIQGTPYGPLKPRDSNPGMVRLSAGGVGRNIAENTARLGIPTRLISVLGDDLYGARLRWESNRAGIDMSQVDTLSGESTGVYLSVLDETGEMKLAVSAMEICDRMDRAFIDRKKDILAGSSLVVLDTNLPEGSIRHALSLMERQRVIVDLVSAAKATRIRGVLDALHTVKPNRLEAEALTGIEVTDRDSLDRTARFFHDHGVRDVFVSLGAEGTYYSDGESRGILRAGKVRVVSVAGAGDAFVAGLVLGNLRGWDVEQKARFATGAALMALSHEETINPAISENGIIQILGDVEVEKVE